MSHFQSAVVDERGGFMRRQHPAQKACGVGVGVGWRCVGVRIRNQNQKCFIDPRGREIACVTAKGLKVWVQTEINMKPLVFFSCIIVFSF